MKKFTIFLLALLMGVGVMAPNLWATSYDPSGFPGSRPQPPSTAMINNHGMLGDALFGEIYRAVAPEKDPFFGDANVVTYFSIENQSGKYVAAHVRLRSGRFSIEAVDFPILLSPYDVFWFQAETTLNAQGQQIVRLLTSDVHTYTISGLPNVNSPLAQVSFDPNNPEVLRIDLVPYLLQQFNMPAEYKTNNELTMGYVEVFGLFSISKLKAGDNFYNVMAALWGDTTGKTIPGFGNTLYASYRYGTDAIDRVAALDVGKALSGHVFIGDFQNGLYTGYTMKALKDFRAGVGDVQQACLNDILVQLPWYNCVTHPISQRDLQIRSIFNAGGINVNPATILYNVGYDAAYTDPDWATTFGPTWNDGDNYYGDPLFGATSLISEHDPNAFFGIDELLGFLVDVASVRSFSLDEVEDAIYKSVLQSTYFNGGFSWSGGTSDGTFSLMALTFPTKFLHFFFDEGSGLPTTGLWNNSWPVGNGSSATATRHKLNPDDLFNGVAQIGASTGIVDLEEHGTLEISPNVTLNLPWEVNLLPIGAESRVALADFGFLVDKNLTPFDVAYVPYNAGQFVVGAFNFVGGVTGGDPRYAWDPAYWGPVAESVHNFPINLNVAHYWLAPGFTVAATAQMFDFEFTNYPHARMYDPTWDNYSLFGGSLYKYIDQGLAPPTPPWNNPAIFPGAPFKGYGG